MRSIEPPRTMRTSGSVFKGQPRFARWKMYRPPQHRRRSTCAGVNVRCEKRGESIHHAFRYAALARPRIATLVSDRTQSVTMIREAFERNMVRENDEVAHICSVLLEAMSERNASPLLVVCRALRGAGVLSSRLQKGMIITALQEILETHDVACSGQFVERLFKIVWELGDEFIGGMLMRGTGGETLF